MTAITHANPKNPTTQVKTVSLILLKLFSLFLFDQLCMRASMIDSFGRFIRSSTNLLSLFQMVAFTVLGHLLVQATCTLGTTYGTRAFVFWQVFAFVGILIFRSLSVLQGFDSASFLWVYFWRAVADALPTYIVTHQLLHIAFILIVRQRHKRSVVQ